MLMIKPIQATPTLSGKDAIELLKQVNTGPTSKVIKKNNMLKDILTGIRKKK